MVFLTVLLKSSRVHRKLFLFVSTKEALKGAEGRQKELEAEVDRVTDQMKEEMAKVVQQKDEEISRVKAGLEEHQEKQSAETKAREENLRYT